METAAVFYFMCCLVGWGSSTFIMGYIGKLMDFETAIFYNLVGVLLFNIPTISRVQYGFTINHVWAIVNGLAFTLADYAYYKVRHLLSLLKMHPHNM